MNERAPTPEMGDNLPVDLAERLAILRGPLLKEAEALRDRANAAPKKVTGPGDVDAIGAIVRDAKALLKRLDSAHEDDKAPLLRDSRTVDEFFRDSRTTMKKIDEGLTVRVNEYNTRLANEERARKDAEARRLREEEETRRAAAAKAEEANRLAQAGKHVAAARDAEAKADAAESAAAAPLAALVQPTVTKSGLTMSAKTEWQFEITKWAEIDLAELRPYLKRAVVEDAIKQFVKMGGRELAGVRIYESVKTQFK